MAGDLAAMQLLAEHGANPNLATKSADTPLMAVAGVGWAAYWTSNAPYSRLDAAKFCLEHGAVWMQRMQRGIRRWTVRHFAETTRWCSIS